MTAAVDPMSVTGLADPLEQLRAARALLADPERWTQGAAAVTATDLFTDPNGSEAVCFCSIGALWRVAGPHSSALASAALGRHAGVCIEGWNDAPERTHAEVLAAFDAAIANLEAGAK